MGSGVGFLTLSEVQKLYEAAADRVVSRETWRTNNHFFSPVKIAIGETNAPGDSDEEVSKFGAAQAIPSNSVIIEISFAA